MARPFRIETSPTQSPMRRSLLRAAGPVMERAMGLPSLNELYTQINAFDSDRERYFADKALEVMPLALKLNEEALDAIPTTGPLVVVANHPFGGIEGVILASLIRRVRPDVKLLANEMLACIPELRDSFFFVDVFGEDGGTKRRNAAALRQAMAWVGDGHALGVFPSGAVSHLNVKHRNVADPPWNSSTARIIQRTGATVVPVFFDGRNTNLFQLAGLVHPMLRSAMLPRELLKRRRSHVSLVVGAPIAADRTAKLAGRQELTNYLRVRTYLLRPRHRHPDAAAADPPGTSGQVAVNPPESPTTLAEEIAALPAEQTLLTSGDHDVLYARRPQMDALLREIGRLRETAFRQVGEGTGFATDLDRFDEHYVHLLVWNRATAEIVGSYRMGATDEILPTQGVKGLYTSTLFDFRKKLIQQVTPALELGRSFVHPDHQRSFQPLQLLWKGIAAYCVRYPRYRHLVWPGQHQRPVHVDVQKPADDLSAAAPLFAQPGPADPPQEPADGPARTRLGPRRLFHRGLGPRRGQPPGPRVGSRRQAHARAAAAVPEAQRSVFGFQRRPRVRQRARRADDDRHPAHAHRRGRPLLRQEPWAAYRRHHGVG